MRWYPVVFYTAMLSGALLESRQSSGPSSGLSSTSQSMGFHSEQRTQLRPARKVSGFSSFNSACPSLSSRPRAAASSLSLHFQSTTSRRAPSQVRLPLVRIPQRVPLGTFSDA